MTIDVYADIACPWCYVGRARLKQARRRGVTGVPCYVFDDVRAVTGYAR